MVYPLTRVPVNIISMAGTNAQLKAAYKALAQIGTNGDTDKRAQHCPKCHRPKSQLKVWKGGRRVHGCTAKDLCKGLASCGASERKKVEFHKKEHLQEKIRTLEALQKVHPLPLNSLPSIHI